MGKDMTICIWLRVSLVIKSSNLSLLLLVLCYHFYFSYSFLSLLVNAPTP
jgi:hypothetical protein